MLIPMATKIKAIENTIPILNKGKVDIRSFVIPSTSLYIRYP